uniref:Uncharacterized protein n=1 Tax=Rhizophora mucronata TaxID=61149 RepID=A0A2P2PB82_RHIMU
MCVLLLEKERYFWCAMIYMWIFLNDLTFIHGKHIFLAIAYFLCIGSAAAVIILYLKLKSSGSS